MPRRKSLTLIEEHPLILLPSLAAIVGLNEAIFLQQLYYWLTITRHFRDGRDWIYNTFPEWQAQFPFWNERTIRRVVNNLKRKRLIIVRQFNKRNYDQTNWYSIDFDEFERIRQAAQHLSQVRAGKHTLIASKRRAKRGRPVLIDEHNVAGYIDHRITQQRLAGDPNM